MSPGYEEEEKTKPAVTKKIEESDVPMAPEECVRMLLSGESGSPSQGRHYCPSCDFEADLV